MNFQTRSSITVGANESARSWLGMLNNLKNRGVQDVLFFCMDGLAGFKEAINAVYNALNEKAGPEALAGIREKWGKNTLMRSATGKMTGEKRAFFSSFWRKSVALCIQQISLRG